MTSAVDVASPVRERTRAVLLAGAAIAAQVLFVASWLYLGTIEGRGYSAGRHDISDLAALTARHPGIDRAAIGIAGLLTIAFAIGALRPALTRPGLGEPISAWLVALSLPALDNLSDAFFRLDCRAADVGCSSSHAAASWHGQIHTVVGGISALITVITPFALAARMRRVDGWRDLAGPAIAFGAVVFVSMVGYGVFYDTARGSAQRGAAVLVPLGLVVLALRVRRLALDRNTVLDK